MSHKLIDDFMLLDLSSIEKPKDNILSAEAYKKLSNWAGQARGKTPKFLIH